MTYATDTETEVLRELVRDVQAVGAQHVKANWPDLYETYLRAIEILAHDRDAPDQCPIYGCEGTLTPEGPHLTCNECGFDDSENGG